MSLSDFFWDLPDGAHALDFEVASHLDYMAKTASDSRKEAKVVQHVFDYVHSSVLFNRQEAIRFFYERMRRYQGRDGYDTGRA